MKRIFPLTKLEMVRVIVQGIYRLEQLPSENHPKVRELMRMKKEDLLPSYKSILKDI